MCNAAESLLVHARRGRRASCRALAAALDGVELVGDDAHPRASCPASAPATEDDCATEFLDLQAGRRGSSTRSTRPSTTSPATAPATARRSSPATCGAADRFTREVDAAAVLVNASTRFVDGEEFGFGAEIGICTQKLHARGPMGLRELTTAKYVVRGDGQIRT